MLKQTAHSTLRIESRITAINKNMPRNDVRKYVTSMWPLHTVLYDTQYTRFRHSKSPFWKVVPGNKMVPSATLSGGSQPATQQPDRLSGHYGTQTDVIRRVAPVALSTLHTISSPRMSSASTFYSSCTVLSRADGKM